MPFDERVRAALAAVAEPARAFRAAMTTTADEIRHYLTSCNASREARIAIAAAELGPLAAGRIDAARFADQFMARGSADGSALGTIEWALATLGELIARGDALLHRRVPPGGSLHTVVAEALSDIGAGFAAARAVARVRAGGAPSALSGTGPLPFSRWSRSERAATPPLVIELAGSDLRAAALAEFMDGRQHIVLVVDGDCPPATLVRLVTPGIFVLQSHDAFDLDRFIAWGGPAIAALVPEGAARFVHDPAAGSTSKERLKIGSLPERPPRRSVAGLSVAQQLEEIDVLRGLAATGAAPAAAPAPVAATTGDPADRLASWLLSQVDLSDGH